MKFCSVCGGKVALKIPEDDNRERFVCTECGAIHYQNPNMVVGAIPVWLDENNEPLILICKRDIEPRLGYWTLPAGFMENGESTSEGAARETMEESCARLENLEMYRVLNVPRTNQVHIFFKADLPEPEFQTTPESSEVKLVRFDEIPWSQLAFPTVYRALQDFVEDWPTQKFEAKMHDIGRKDWEPLELGALDKKAGQ